MTTRPTADAGVTDIVAKVREQRDAAVGIGHPDEAGYIAFLSAILDHIDTLTAQLAAAKADGERLDWMMSDHDGIHVEVHHYGESYGGALSATVFTFDGEYSAKTVREALDAARTGAR